MIKEIKQVKEFVEKHRYCDDCGIEIHRGLACSVATCQYCKKDLCDKCVGHEEDTGGDYRIVYCEKCWSLGDEYRPKIEQLEITISDLYDEWRLKCKAVEK